PLGHRRGCRADPHRPELDDPHGRRLGRDRRRARGLRIALPALADHGAEPRPLAVAVLRHLPRAPGVVGDPPVLPGHPLERAHVPRRPYGRRRLLRPPGRVCGRALPRPDLPRPPEPARVRPLEWLPSPTAPCAPATRLLRPPTSSSG